MCSSTLSLISAIDLGGWSSPRSGRLVSGKDPVPLVWEDGWAPEPVWKGAENLAPTEIRSLDRPVLSESLYRLSYPSPQRQLDEAEIDLSKPNSWRMMVVVVVSNFDKSNWINLSINLTYEAGNLWSCFIEVFYFFIFFRWESDKPLRTGKIQWDWELSAEGNIWT